MKKSGKSRFKNLSFLERLPNIKALFENYLGFKVKTENRKQVTKETYYFTEELPCSAMVFSL